MFDFGANWPTFSEKRVNAERLDVAAQSLPKLLQRDALTGISFLDVGCGCGLFVIAAYQLSVAKVVGVDIHPLSIASSTYNRERLTPQAPPEFVEMSVLDQDKLRTLGAFDLVYAWGSLHHIGAIWPAIKRVYSRLPRWAQSIVAVPFGGVIYLAKLIVTRRNRLEK